MKAKDLYLMKPESESKDIYCLIGFYYNHIPEIDDVKGFENNIKIVIKTVKEFYFDCRRFWALRTVWFEDKPVMVIQNAGREGDDHHDRFITNKDLYKEMINYINSLFTEEECSIFQDVVDELEDIPMLTKFYENDLHGNFERY